MALTGREKATIFLSILGAEVSARVLRYLPDEMADLIASGINHLPTPSPDALSEVVRDFSGFLALPDKNLGEPPPRQISAAPSTPSPPPPPPPKPKRSFAQLMYERPQTVAFVLSLLPEVEQEEALNSFARDRAIIKELLNNLRKNPLSAKIEKILREKFKDKIFVGAS